MTDVPTFTVGPPEAVTDSRLLPAVTADDEAGFVHGADLEEHPDNVPLQAGELDVVGPAQIPAEAADELPPLETLDAVVAGIDVDAVDVVGFDATVDAPPDAPVDEPIDPDGAGGPT